MKKTFPEVEATPQICILGAVLLLTVPLPWVIGAVLAAAFHELCHIVTIYALGGRVYRFRIGGSGASLETGNLSYGRELLAAAAGPAGSLLLLMFLHRTPRLAVCGGIQGLYNLIPLYPMDGGRILKCILAIIFPEHRAMKIFKGTQIGILSAILLGVIVMCLKFHWGHVLPAFGFFLILRAFLLKIPCKQQCYRVQ